jgi:hypothetical protein
MALKPGSILWYETNGPVPIRIGIPSELMPPQVKAELEEFLSAVAGLAAELAEKVTFGDLLRARRNGESARACFVGSEVQYKSL